MGRSLATGARGCGWITVALVLAGWLGSARAEAPRFGLMLDAGVPDGLGAALVVRPTPRVRIHAGGGHNLIAPGVHAGVSISAFPFWITPSVSVEVGRAFSGDANRLGTYVSGEPTDEAILRDIRYDYAAARVGLELGFTHATFFVHAGMSLVHGTVGNLQESFRDEMEDPEQPPPRVSDHATVRIISPSATAGLIVYF